MLAPEELADMRSVSNDALEARCDIVRNVRQQQPNHSFKDVEQTVSSNLPCRMVPTGQTPLELAAINGEMQQNRLIVIFLLPYGTQVYADDVIKLLATGKKYPVAGAPKRTEAMYQRVYAYDDSKPVVPA